MSDNKYNRTKPSTAPHSASYLEYKSKVISDALSKSKFKPAELDSVQRLLKKAEDVTTKVRQSIKPILQSGGWTDKAAMRHLIMTLYLEAFDTHLLFTREDLVQICALIHTDIMQETIESDPTLSGKPDLLSGV
jgi:hypothetical protein